MCSLTHAYKVCLTPGEEGRRGGQGHFEARQGRRGHHLGGDCREGSWGQVFVGVTQSGQTWYLVGHGARWEAQDESLGSGLQ